jgi:O-antigen ligase/polysaccharide polymerase Wzy-like membrane protein/PDZ domain-containing protein
VPFSRGLIHLFAYECRGSRVLLDNTVHGPPLQNSERAPGPARYLIGSLVSILNSNLASAAPARGRQVFGITEWVISLSLVMYVVFAPHSIALTQGSYLIGLAAWGVQLAATRNLKHKRTPVDIALFGFFACCVVSSFLSYDPLVSIKGLKSPAFFLAFYFVSNNVKSIRFAGFLALIMIVSCLVNVGYSGVRVAIGRGLQIESIGVDSPFANESIRTGDVILAADDTVVNSSEDLTRIIDSQRGRLRLKIQRKEAIAETSIPRQAIKEASGVGFERLGITTSPGRNFRITGFYSHYETYAEVLQLIAALLIGILIAIPNKSSRSACFLAGLIPLFAVTLILTGTRAALAGLATGVAMMALASSRRRVVLAAVASVVVVLPMALVAVEHSRGISVFDPDEGSTAYRLEVWREALGIIEDHPMFGIGKGSEAKLKQSLGLYDEGRLPPGHFHSTPVQVAVWWGLLGLIFYCSFMTIFIIEIWRLIKLVKLDKRWQLYGIALGGLGAAVAFNVSSLVHFNFGDGEVVMVFWLLTGLAFAVRRIASQAHDVLSPSHISVPPSPDSSDRNPLLEQATAFEPSARVAKAKQN